MQQTWFFLLASGLFLGSITAKEFEVRVAADGGGMEQAVVAVKVPKDFPERGLLRSVQSEVPFQKNLSGEAVFVMSGPPAGEDRVWKVAGGAIASVAPLGSIAKSSLEQGRVHLSVDGRKIITYQGHETALPRPEIKPIFKRGGYIHPVYSPSGKVITDDYPSNHIHHHGVWFPWTKTVFEGREPDFWNMGEGKGKVEFVAFGDHWSGPVHAGFAAKHRFIDLTSGEPKAALDESWVVTAYSIPGANYSVFDLVSTQTCATASALKLPKYHYGGLGFRGNWDWNGTNKTIFLTSNGETNRVKGNETRGNWCYMGGEVDGATSGMAGMVVLCHPENFQAPQPMRLHPGEPFFCFAPSQSGDWSIEPGKPYVSQYRFISFDGVPDKAKLDALWAAYAHPPKVVVQEK